MKTRVCSRWQKGKRRGYRGPVGGPHRVSVGSSNGRGSFGDPSVQLCGDRDRCEVIATDQLGMPKNEAPAQCGGDQ